MSRVFVGSILALVMLPASLAAQSGDRTAVIHPLVFQLTQTDVVLDPTADVAPASRVEFIRTVQPGSIANPDLGLGLLVGILDNVGIDIPGWVVDFIEGVGDFSSVDVSASLGPFLEADYGGYFQVKPTSRASFELNNPVNIVSNVPAVNSFKCGDEVAIHTQPQYRSDASLQVRPSFYDFEIGPVFKDIEFGVQVGVDIDICVGLDIPVIGCAGYPAEFHPPRQRVGMTVPLPSFLDPMPPLISVCSAAFRPGANEADLLGCSAGPLTPLFNLWQAELDVLNSVPGVHYSFAEFSPGQVRIFTPDLPTPLNFTVPEVEGLFKQPAPVLGVGAAADGRVVAAQTQGDLARASLDLVSLLEYAKIPTGLSLGGGLGAIDLGDISPTFHIDQKMRYEFAPTMTASMTLGASMPYRVIDPVSGVVASGTGSTVSYKPGQSVVLSFPQALRTPVPVTSTFAMTGSLNTKTAHQYRLSTQFKALKLSGPGFEFAALDEEIDLSGSILPEHPLENNTLALPPFAPVTAPALTLDPEDPRITVTEHSVRDTLNLGGGERAVVYRTTVKNDGDVPLLNANLQLELSRVFGAAQAFQTVCVASADLAVNQEYDGLQSTNLLEPATMLAPGDEGSVDVLVRVAPAVARQKRHGCFAPVTYWSSSFAEASTALGSLIRSDFDQCTGKKTGHDIKTVVNLGASDIDDLDDFAIYGSDGVTFDRASGVSRGNVGSGRSMMFKRSGTSTEMLQIVGDLHAGRDIHVQQSQVSADYVQVRGDLHVARKSSLASTGAISECSECNEKFEIRPVWGPREFWGAPRVTVPHGGTVALDPGKYRLLNVRGQSTVTLRAGTYVIDDLVIAGDAATFVFDVADGPIRLTLGSWQMHKVDGLKLLVPSGDTRKVKINYAGHGQLTFRNAVVQGTLIAPEADVRLTDSTVLYGAAYAESVEIGPASQFHHHRYLEPLKIADTCIVKLQEAIKTPLIERQ